MLDISVEELESSQGAQLPGQHTVTTISLLCGTSLVVTSTVSIALLLFLARIGIALLLTSVRVVLAVAACVVIP
jgi:hypothetical protein